MPIINAISAHQVTRITASPVEAIDFPNATILVYYCRQLNIENEKGERFTFHLFSDLPDGLRITDEE
jgi:hypothetical protein